MIDESRSFWTSLPGILTGLETGVTSVTGLFIAINGGMPKADDQGDAKAAVMYRASACWTHRPRAGGQESEARKEVT